MSITLVTHGGLLFRDTFNRANGPIDGDNGWINSNTGSESLAQGDWDILSNVLKGSTTSGTGDFPDRCYNTSANASVLTIQARARFLATGGAVGLRSNIIAPPTIYTELGCYFAADGVFPRTVANGADGFPASNFTATGMVANTWYVIKYVIRYDAGSGETKMSAWINTTKYIDDAVLFSGAPTAGYVGIHSVATATEYDNLVVTNSTVVTLTNLEEGQGFRIYDAADNLIASSGAQSGEQATADLLDTALPIDGYILLYNDAGTWLEPIDRYEADDIYGGDEYRWSGLPSLPTWLIQCNLDGRDGVGKWAQANSDLMVSIGCLKQARVTRRAEVGRADNVDTAVITLEDTAQEGEPANLDSALFPYFTWGREVRVVADYLGTLYAIYYGTISQIETGTEWPYECIITCESPLRAYLGRNVTPTRITDGWVYNSDAPESSALVKLLESAGIDEAQWDLDAGVYEPLPGDWGGAERTFGDYLSELVRTAGTMAYVQPRYRALEAEPDWLFRWVDVPSLVSAAADLDWDATAGGWMIRPVVYAPPSSNGAGAGGGQSCTRSDTITWDEWTADEFSSPIVQLYNGPQPEGETLGIPFSPGGEITFHYAPNVTRALPTGWRAVLDEAESGYQAQTEPWAWDGTASSPRGMPILVTPTVVETTATWARIRFDAAVGGYLLAALSGTVEIPVVSSTEICAETPVVEAPTLTEDSQRRRLVELQYPGSTMTWTRRNKPWLQLAIDELGQKVVLTAARPKMSNRPHMLVEITHVLESSGNPVMINHSTDYIVEKLPGTDLAGNSLWFTWGLAGSGWGQGRWR